MEKLCPFLSFQKTMTAFTLLANYLKEVSFLRELLRSNILMNKKLHISSTKCSLLSITCTVKILHTEILSLRIFCWNLKISINSMSRLLTLDFLAFSTQIKDWTLCQEVHYTWHLKSFRYLKRFQHRSFTTKRQIYGQQVLSVICCSPVEIHSQESQRLK